MNRISILNALADPNRAWIVLLVGLLMVYRELVAPGRVLPGVFGAVAITTATYSLAQHELRTGAAMMIVAGIACLVVQGFRHWFWLPTATAAVLITWGAHKLTARPISLPVAAGSIPLCAVSGFLLRTAVIARRKKTSVD